VYRERSPLIPGRLQGRSRAQALQVRPRDTPGVPGEIPSYPWEVTREIPRCPSPSGTAQGHPGCTRGDLPLTLGGCKGAPALKPFRYGPGTPRVYQGRSPSAGAPSPVCTGGRLGPLPLCALCGDPPPTPLGPLRCDQLRDSFLVQFKGDFGRSQGCSWTFEGQKFMSETDVLL